jgi:hypothetical protein
MSNKDVLVIPGFKGSPDLQVDMSTMREAEARLIEAKTVNPVTYIDLEHTFNEAWRTQRTAFGKIGYQIALAETHLEKVKSDILIDQYPDFMKDKPRSQDSADMREAFYMRQPEYVEALTRIDQLKAMEAYTEGNMKTIENTCRYMRKQMDLVLRSGLSGANLYITQGKK